MRCRASTSAPATVAAHRSRNDGDAAVPRSASAADRAASSSAVVGPPISTAATVACWRRTCSFAAATVTASFAARSSGAGAAVNAAPSSARNTSMTAVYAEPTRSVGNAEPVTARRSAARSASRSRAAASRSAAAGSELGGRQGAHRRRGRVDLLDLGVELVAARAAPARDVSLGEQPLTLQGVDEPGDLLTRADLADQRVERTGVVVGRHDAQRAERPDHEQRHDQHRGQLRAQPPVPQPPAAPIAHCGSPSGPPDGRPHGATPGRDRRHLVAGRPSSGRNRSGLRPDGPVPLRQLSGHPGSNQRNGSRTSAGARRNAASTSARRRCRRGRA